MKRWLVIILALVIISGILFYAILHEAKITSLESIVPEDVIYYIYAYNLDKKIKDFQSSAFFQELSKSSVYRKFIEPKLEKIKQRAPFLSNFLEKDIAFVIFSLGSIGTSKSDIGNAGDFLALVRLDPKKSPKIKKYIADFYITFCAKDSVISTKYKGIKIIIYKLLKEKTEIAYAFLSDVIVVGNNVDIVKKSIDLFKRQNQNSLLNNKDFQQVTAKIKEDALFWGYGNSKNYYQEILRRYAYSSLKSRDSRDARFAQSLFKMKSFINLMNILKGYAFYLDYDELKEGFVFRSYHTLDSSMDTEGLLDIIAYKKAVDKNTFSLIPKDTIVYYGGSQDLVKTWNFLRRFYGSFDEIMRAEMKADPRYYQYKDKIDEMGFENAFKKFESFLGVNIEKDILAALGNNFGAAFVRLDDVDIPLTGPQATSGLPRQQSMPILFPQIYVFFELKDTVKIQKVMETVRQHFIDNVNQIIKERERKRQENLNLPGPQGNQNQDNKEQQPAAEEKKPLSLKIDSYKDVNIYRIELLDFPIALLNPNYCILDKYIIFSLSLPITEKIIDIYNTKRGTFSSNFDFESVQANLPSDYSNIMFFDFKNMIKNITRSRFFINLQPYLIKNPKKDFSKEDLDSVLNVLSNISNFTFINKLLDPDTIESSLYIKIKGL